MRHLLIALALATSIGSAPALSCPLSPRRISIAPGGIELNAGSDIPFISGNGRFITYRTDATNLFAETPAGVSSVALYDRVRKRTTVVSRNTAGKPGNGYSSPSDISFDGRFIVFSSEASDLVAGDTNSRSDAFIYDRVRRTTTRISFSLSGVELNGNSYASAISSNGRFVLWQTYATNVSAVDTDALPDLYLYDRRTRTSQLISVATDGTKGNGSSYGNNASISDDGRYVGFWGDAANLGAPGSNRPAHWSVFRRDRRAGTTTLVNVTEAGVEGLGDSARALVSGNGRHVGFWSNASLISTDTNGVTDGYLRDMRREKTILVSTNRLGTLGDQTSRLRHMTRDTRFLSFVSSATNLFASNGLTHVFMRRNRGRYLEVLSVNRDGALGNGNSEWPVASQDGRWAAYYSSATNLVANDTNASSDVFLVRTSVARSCR